MTAMCRTYWILALMAAANCYAPPCQSAPEEIQVYLDDMSSPGRFGVDVHNNYVFASSILASYSGEQPPSHVFRLTPEFYYGLSPTVELGLYVLSTHSPDRGPHMDGAKVRIKFVAPHHPTTGLFWGANLEIGDTGRRVSETPWNGELKGILGYRAGPWLFAVNPNLDWSLSAHGGPVMVDVDFKVARSINPRTQLGIETYNDFGPLGSLEPLGRNSKTVYAVVDQEFAAVDVNAGIGRGLTTESDDWLFKLIVGKRF